MKIQVFEMVVTKDPEPVWDKEVEVAEKWIHFVDESVSASKLFTSDFVFPRDNECRLKKGRATTRLSNQEHISLRYKLLDKDS